MPYFQVMKSIEINTDDLTISVTLNNRLDSEDYYSKPGIKRRDIACVQFREGNRHFCNVFLSCKGVEQIDQLPECPINVAIRAVIRELAEREFGKLTTKYVNDHVAFFKEMDTKYGKFGEKVK